MKVGIRRTRRGNYAALAANVSNLPRSFWDRTGAIVAAGIVDNILAQKQASGEALKKNAPSTRDRKAREGKPQLSLVDALHRFIKGSGASWKVLRYLPRGRGIIVGPATLELSRIIRYVGEKGYVGYVGISAKTAAALKALLRGELRAMFRRAR